MAGAINERLAASTNKDEAPTRDESVCVLALLEVGLVSKTIFRRILNFEEDEFASFGSFADGCLMHHNFGARAGCHLDLYTGGAHL